MYSPRAATNSTNSGPQHNVQSQNHKNPPQCAKSIKNNKPQTEQRTRGRNSTTKDTKEHQRKEHSAKTSICQRRKSHKYNDTNNMGQLHCSQSSQQGTKMLNTSHTERTTRNVHCTMQMSDQNEQWGVLKCSKTRGGKKLAPLNNCGVCTNILGTYVQSFWSIVFVKCLFTLGMSVQSFWSIAFVKWALTKAALYNATFCTIATFFTGA